MSDLTILTDEHVTKVCHFPQGHATCAFLGMSGMGFVCTKQDPSTYQVILLRLSKGEMNAKGNYCKGPDQDFEPMDVAEEKQSNH